MAETPARGGGPDRWRAEAEARVASLAKPPGALGPRHGAAPGRGARTGASVRRAGPLRPGPGRVSKTLQNILQNYCLLMD